MDLLGITPLIDELGAIKFKIHTFFPCIDLIFKPDTVFKLYEAG